MVAFFFFMSLFPQKCAMTKKKHLEEIFKRGSYLQHCAYTRTHTHTLFFFLFNIRLQHHRVLSHSDTLRSTETPVRFATVAFAGENFTVYAWYLCQWVRIYTSPSLHIFLLHFCSQFIVWAAFSHCIRSVFISLFHLIVSKL